jgi:hypothetical protein
MAGSPHSLRAGAPIQNGARIQSEKARYDELKKGSRPEVIKIKEIELSQERQTLSNYYSDLSQTINDAYNKADDAVNKQTDPIFSNDQGSNPQINFTINDQQIKNDVENLRVKAGTSLKNIGGINDQILLLNNISSHAEEADLALSKVKKRIIVYSNFLN